MKRIITESDFIDEFIAYDRENHFSYEGKEALYDYLTGIEEDANIEIELDVIDLCCSYSEYEDFEELQQDYADIESIEELKDYTTVIKINGGGIIIERY